MKRIPLLLIPAIVLGAYLLTGVAQVRPGQRAVVRRFGRVVAQPGPGLWVGFPYGIDAIEKVPIKFVRQVEVGYKPQVDSLAASPSGQFLTGDQNLVNIALAIDYSVGDGDDALVQYVIQKERVEATLMRIADAMLADWVGSRSVDDVLLTGKVTLRSFLMSEIQRALAPYRLGVQLQLVSVTHLAAPDEVKNDFERVMAAQSAIRTLENEARQYAANLVRQAQSDENHMLQSADAYAQGRLALGRADAEGFRNRLTQYRRLRQTNPDILTAIWWSELGKLLLGMKASGQIDLLDARIGADGLDLMQFARPKKKSGEP